MTRTFTAMLIKNHGKSPSCGHRHQTVIAAEHCDHNTSLMESLP